MTAVGADQELQALAFGMQLAGRGLVRGYREMGDERRRGLRG